MPFGSPRPTQLLSAWGTDWIYGCHYTQKLAEPHSCYGLLLALWTQAESRCKTQETLWKRRTTDGWRDLGASPTGLAESSSHTLRTGRSSQVALHPSPRKRSYHCRLQAGNVSLRGTSTLLIKRPCRHTNCRSINDLGSVGGMVWALPPQNGCIGNSGSSPNRQVP